MTYTVTARDLVDGAVVRRVHARVRRDVRRRRDTVTCTARDARGNQTTASFAVTVTPFPQPDLVVGSVTATSVTITNRGTAAAGVFIVTIQGVGTFTVPVSPQVRRPREPSCASIQRAVTVDPQNQVAESNEANNTARIPPC